MNFHFHLFIPELLSAAMLAYLLAAAVISGKNKGGCLFSQLAAGSAVLGAALFLTAGKTGTGFGGMLTADAAGFYFKCLFTAVFFITALMCRGFFKETEDTQSFALILAGSLTGLFFLSSAAHLLVIFIALEILTMALYIMAAYRKFNNLSVEAGLKYLLFGSLASAFLIFGIALVYLQTGTFYLSEIAASKQLLLGSKIGVLSLIFIFAGIGFKTAAVPFQAWAPDVYQGAPAPVAGFLSSASKAAGFLLLVRFFILTLGPLDAVWKNTFAVLALLTLLYGSLGALGQTKPKRLLGYSSIAHAGYLLIAAANGSSLSTAAILFYLAGYAAAALAVFYVIAWIEKHTGSDIPENFDGLAEKNPLLAGAFTVGVLSLAGIPPLAGFAGKFWILLMALDAHQIWLAAAAAVMVVVGIGYYFPLILRVYFRPAQTGALPQLPAVSKFALIALSLLSIAIGFCQTPFMRAALAAIPS